MKTDFNLLSVIEETVELFTGPADAKGVNLTALVADAVPLAVSGDRGRIRQVLTNVIGNAIKFTDHGEVSVRATLGQEEGDTVVVRVAVSDTGIGISGEGAGAAV